MGIRAVIAHIFIFVLLSDFGVISEANYRFRGGFAARRLHTGINNQILGPQTLSIPDYSLPDL